MNMVNDNFTVCLKEAELAEGHMRGVYVKGKPILLAKVAGQVFGMFNRCPHMGCSFERGILQDHIVMCPCHGWKFDLRTGQYQEINEVILPCYRCKIENGKIYVEIPKDE
jgi:nitrite reductase/ring-hydroxylating ferredoxin subunit